MSRRSTSAEFDPRIADWLEDDPDHAPETVLTTVLAAFPSIPQRRTLRVPWRTRPMTLTNRLLAGAAALAVVVIAGTFILRPAASPSAGGGPTPSLPPAASGGASAPSSSSSAAASASSVAVPALTQPFSSKRHGYSISIPANWTVKAATVPWPAGVQAASPPDPMLDVFADPSDPTRSLVVVSQPLANGRTPAAWLAAYEASAPNLPAVCWPAPDQMEQATINRQPAWIHGGLSNCTFTEAVTFAGSRVYEVTAYFPFGLAPIDRTLFDAVLATVGFEPAAADDSPAVSARPS
jgi:hypothetical protein